MHLTRCQDQNSRTLEEYCADLTRQEQEYERTRGFVTFRGRGQALLDLIVRLRAVPNEHRVFGLISVDRLCLLATDTWRSPWFVIISAMNKERYHIEYLMPERLAPWRRATVNGNASSEEEAVAMIVTAMERSEGWLAGGPGPIPQPTETSQV